MEGGTGVISELILGTGVLSSLLRSRDLTTLHRLLSKLLELGFISRSEYESLMDELVELANTESESEFEERARALKGRVAAALSAGSEGRFQWEVLMRLHSLLHDLLRKKLVSPAEYESLMDELVELANTESESEFEERARKLEGKLRARER